MVVKICKTSMTRNFETMGGKMDLYGCLEYQESENSHKVTLGRTKTLWNVGQKAQWDYTCKNFKYDAAAAPSACLWVSVFEDNLMLKNTLCGTAKLELSSEITSSKKEFVELPIYLGESEVTGSVTINISMIEVQTGKNKFRGSMLQNSLVPFDDFESPVKRLGVSGGTAPFFKLVYKGEEKDKSPSYYIGKDLSRATDEIVFYESLLEMKKTKTYDIALTETLINDYTFDYAGVLTTKELDAAEDSPDLELLCLRNLYDGMSKLRFLDIKMGQRTAAANWQGKSRARAMKQQLLDGWTNSACEGFRLEGFDGPPPNLASMDPLLDTGITDVKSLKKALRFMYQRLTGTDIMMYFMDTHQEPAGDAEKFDLNTTVSPSEYAEIVLAELVSKIVKLSISCHNVPVPQKWIGSSVALGFDAGELPARSDDDDYTLSRKKVICAVFDWGRSELNTIQNFEKLSDETKKDRNKFWKYYTAGMDKLAYDISNLYYNRFSNTSGWDTVTFFVYDFDSMTANDFIGKVTVPVEDTKGESRTEKLIRNTVNPFRKIKKSEITYSMTYIEYPQSSRLQGSWQVTLKSCTNLPKMDYSIFSRDTNASDPYCFIVGESKDGKHSFSQQSTMKSNDLNPEWNEVFDFPVPKNDSDKLSTALGPQLANEDHDKFFAAVETKGGRFINVKKIKSSNALNKQIDGFPHWCRVITAVKE